MYLINEKLLKFDKKIKKETEDILIDKKPLKLNEKIKKKLIIYCFMEDEKLLKLS